MSITRLFASYIKNYTANSSNILYIGRGVLTYIYEQNIDPLRYHRIREERALQYHPPPPNNQSLVSTILNDFDNHIIKTLGQDSEHYTEGDTLTQLS